MIRLLCKILPNRFYDSELHAAGNGETFSYNGEILTAKVVNVYDGDTITVCFRYRGELQRHKVRMLGYDSPEMRPSKKKVNRDAEIAAAIEARDELRSCIDDKIVELRCGKFDHFGRILANVYYNHRDINQHMISNGFGVEYTCGKKKIQTF